MVAAGGGGSAKGYKGGNAGGLFSLDAKGYNDTPMSAGANQTHGYMPVEGQPGRDSAHEYSIGA